MGSKRTKGASRKAALLGMIVFAFAAGASAGPQLLTPPSIPAPPPRALAPSTQESRDPFAVFTPQEMKAFVAAAVKADALKDPMKRCLNFPDPPGSHWSREGVAAYCHYFLQPTVSLAEFDRLVTSGHAKELDQRFSSWAADSKDHPDAFWHFLLTNFLNGDAVRQTLIESWKQQSPDSAFAYALSGWNYTYLGWAARGDAYGDDTPQASLDAMANSMERARGDIEKAIQLNPKLSAPYATMISLGTAMGDHAYVSQGARQGLQERTGKYAVFTRLALYTSARWYGSPGARQWLLSQVDQSDAEQPLLHVIRPFVLAYDAGIDHRDPVDGDWTVYRRVFDDVAMTSILKAAGEAALRHRQYAVAYVYLSEAARSDASNEELSRERAQSLSFVDLSSEGH
jgi:hypothetical protein